MPRGTIFRVILSKHLGSDNDLCMHIYVSLFMYHYLGIIFYVYLFMYRYLFLIIYVSIHLSIETCAKYLFTHLGVRIAIEFPNILSEFPRNW